MPENEPKMHGAFRPLTRSGDPVYVTRWFACWQQFDAHEIAGTLAGQTGRGTFVVRTFHQTRNRRGEDVVWVEGVDEEAAPDASPNVLSFMDLSLDTVFEWNDPDLWAADDELLLRDGKEAGLLLGESGLLELRRGDPTPLLPAFEKLKLAAQPAPLASPPKPVEPLGW